MIERRAGSRGESRTTLSPTIAFAGVFRGSSSRLKAQPGCLRYDKGVNPGRQSYPEVLERPVCTEGVLTFGLAQDGREPRVSETRSRARLITLFRG
jgi:hypothetical protein